MSRGRRGYGSYRGRLTLTDFLKLLVGILAVLVVLAGAALLLGQNYIVYTDAGPRLELPFFSREKPAQPDISGPAAPMVEPPAVTPPTPTPAPEPEPAAPMAAVAVPLTSVLDGTAASLAAAAGANAVILDMKTDQGALGFVSRQSMADKAEVNAQNALSNQVLAELNRGELYTVARISCFKDHALAKNETYAIRTNSGYRWTDPDKLRWSSPTNEAVQDYLTALAVELAELGFDEILLDNCGYPTQGNLGYIKRGASYDPAALPTVIEAFCGKLQTALEAYDVKLSIRTAPAVLTGEDTRSGQTAALLERYADGLWMRGSADELTALLTQSGVTRPGERLTLLVDALDPTETLPQAVF